jgi:hypothetical protein
MLLHHLGIFQGNFFEINESSDIEKKIFPIVEQEQKNNYDTLFLFLLD